VGELLSRPEHLAESAAGILGRDEIGALVRQRSATVGRVSWTPSDLAVLDEANYLINGRMRTYGHIVCDEAQDLTPMQFRMLARRTASGSVTVLGDIAQATGSHPYESWDEILQHLPPSPDLRLEELTLGYRAPAQLLDLASRLLPVTAPSIRATSSVRVGRVGPTILQVHEEELVGQGLDRALAFADEGFLVGLIVPEGLIEAMRSGSRGDHRVGRLDDHGITKPVTIVPAPAVKGLEFDAAVVVEPAAIAGGERVGLRLLYVALTRPIQRLTIVHHQRLPPALEGGSLQ
jgi:DNA helicase IV